MKRYDLVVIGAGSGGFAAARVATGYEKRVALIDKGPFGGLCILKGCMPSKTLLRSSELAHLAGTSKELGVAVQGLALDYPGIISRKNKIIKGFADYRWEDVRSNPRIDFIEGAAQFRSPGEVQVGAKVIQGDRFVISTGSTPVIPSIPGLRETGFITSDEALERIDLPRPLAVLGGGAVALELGQHFSRMGVKVSIFERRSSLLSREDGDIGLALFEYLREERMEIYTNVDFERISSDGSLKQVEARVKGRPLCFKAEEILVATGRQAALGGLNLEAAWVAYTPKGVVVNEEMQTSVPSIFAAGDATGIHPLTHVAVYQGEIAGHNAFSDAKRKADYRLVPQIIFTDPTFAKVGMTEKEAREKGLEVIVAAYPFDDLGKAICTGQTKGYVKMLADAGSGEILGVHLLGPEGASLIYGMNVAMRFRATVHQLLEIPYFHPALSEIFTYPAEEIAQKVSHPIHKGLH